MGARWARSSSSALSASLNPVVPMTRALPAAATALAELRLTTGAVKSMTTAPGAWGSRTARVSATGQAAPASLPRCSLLSTMPARL